MQTGRSPQRRSERPSGFLAWLPESHSLSEGCLSRHREGGCFLQSAEPNTKFQGKETSRPQSEVHTTSLQMDAKETEAYESPAKLLKINTLRVFNVLVQGIQEPKGK